MQGMLWLPKWGKGRAKITFEDAVRRAARYYKNKYGVPPTTCRASETEGIEAVQGVRIVLDNTITPKHFLLTEEKENGS